LSVTRRIFESPKYDECVWRPGSAQTHSGNHRYPRPPSHNQVGVLLLSGREGREGEGNRQGRGERKLKREGHERREKDREERRKRIWRGG